MKTHSVETFCCRCRCRCQRHHLLVTICISHAMAYKMSCISNRSCMLCVECYSQNSKYFWNNFFFEALNIAESIHSSALTQMYIIPICQHCIKSIGLNQFIFISAACTTWSEIYNRNSVLNRNNCSDSRVSLTCSLFCSFSRQMAICDNEQLNWHWKI